MVRPARLERAACGFEVRRSIRLSYGRAKVTILKNLFKFKKIKKEDDIREW
jgi:hypothetical protein